MKESGVCLAFFINRTISQYKHFQTELTIIKFNVKNLEDRLLKLSKQYLYLGQVFVFHNK